MTRSTPPSHPPAWYRDPDRPDRLRRWDGHGWTAEVRPVPAWVQELSLAPGPPRRRRTRLLWAASVACWLAAMVGFGLQRAPVPDAERLTDTAFARRADGVCTHTDETVVGPAQARRGEVDDAERLRDVLAGWEAMVERLQRLPVAAADQRAVARWLDAWDEFLSLGHRYVDAVGRGDDGGADRLSRASEASKQRIDRFAAANGMTGCLF